MEPGHKFEGLDCPVESGEDCVMPQRRGWGIDRSVNPVYVGVLITLIISLLVWGGGPNGVNSHLSTIDTTLVQHEKEDLMVEKRVDKLESRTDSQLKDINDKLDRLIERRR